MKKEINCPYKPCGQNEECRGCIYDVNKSQISLKDFFEKNNKITCKKCKKHQICKKNGKKMHFICVNFEFNEICAYESRHFRKEWLEIIVNEYKEEYEKKEAIKSENKFEIPKDRRMNTTEILTLFPSMWMSGKPEHYKTVVARYYGDKEGYYEIKPTDNPSNIEAVDNFNAKMYYPKKLLKYNFNHGQAYILDDGTLIHGTLSIKYGNNQFPYELTLFHNHANINGFNVWVGDCGKTTVQYFEHGYSSYFLKKQNRKDINIDVINKLFTIVETSHDYGYAAKEIVKCAKEMLNKNIVKSYNCEVTL